MLKSFNKFTTYWLLLPISTFLYSGMLLWVFQKGEKRGSGAGTVTSIFTTGLLVALYPLHPSWISMLFITVFVVIIGTLTIENAEIFMRIKWGIRKRHTGEKVKYDFNETTIDETAGILIAALPIYIIEGLFAMKIGFGYFLFLQIVALASFRLFDAKNIGLTKWPEDNMNKQSSITIMVDDVIAGIYAMLITIGFAVISYVVIPIKWILK